VFKGQRDLSPRNDFNWLWLETARIATLSQQTAAKGPDSIFPVIALTPPPFLDGGGAPLQASVVTSFRLGTVRFAYPSVLFASQRFQLVVLENVARRNAVATNCSEGPQQDYFSRDRNNPPNHGLDGGGGMRCDLAA
jgi:hypothetical protein